LSTTGTNSNDILLGTSSNDNIGGGEGNDTIFGGGGADVLSGDNGNDVIDGGAGNDSLSGGNGNDVLNGGAGSDLLFGNNGDDTAVYVAVDNLTAHDVYEGGNGTDTLVLKLTRTQLDAMNASTVFADFRATVGASSGFDFSAYGFSFNIHLTAKGFERIQTVLIADPAAPTAHADGNAIREDADSSTITGNLLANDATGGIADATLSVANAGVLDGRYGTLTLNPDGTYGYLLDQANAAVDALNNGDALQETFAYTITDGYSRATSQLTITINGHTDPGPLFTAGDDVADFNSILAGSYRAGTQYDALAGNDTVILPGNAAEAAEAGFVIGTAFHAGDGQNTIFGGALDDIVIGGNGADTIDGGAGNDTLSGGAGDDRVFGAGGNDLVIGGAGSDDLDGGAGINRVTYEGSDVGLRIMFVEWGGGRAFKGEGPNAAFDQLRSFQEVVGSNFADRMVGYWQNEVFFGGGGDDVLDGNEGNDRLHGGAGSDVIEGGSGDDTILGEDGDDVVIGGMGSDDLDGGAGINRLDYRGSFIPVVIDLGPAELGGGFAIKGDPAFFVFGTDQVRNFQEVFGSNAGDRIVGDAQDNLFLGFRGDDVLDGGAGNDRIEGGAGDDVMIGGAGNDDLDGGEDIDRVVYAGSDVGLTIMLGPAGPGEGFARKGDAVDAPVDRLRNVEDIVGSNFDDHMVGDAWNNLLVGGGGNDVLDGAAGHDRLDGGAGDDLLYGGAGDDRIDGGAGNDRFEGGSGHDSQRGGDGDDLFISDAFDNTIDGGEGIDTIDYSGLLFDLQINYESGWAGAAPITFVPIDAFVRVENVIGGRGNDRIIGDDGDNRITGYLGNDFLAGLGGRDVFHFDLSDGANVGNDIIMEFEVGIDRISLAGGRYDDLADLNAQQVGTDTVLDLGAGMRLTLVFTNAALLSNSDFMFF
jgi:VCBS repeat-containing protein